MKSISGSVVSSSPISLKKAARTLSRFVSTETGASQAVSAYLKRASASFNHLLQFHKELKTLKKSERKNRQKPLFETVDRGNFTGAEKNPSGDKSVVFHQDRNLNLGDRDGNFDDEKGSRKKKRRDLGEEREGDKEKEGERKKRKKVEVENGSADRNEEHRKKKRRKQKGGD
ncbi:uncharacterized protein LOC143892464 [Tasmannia lanceolata]|uniref:uncharacterized protein LOC143892464 n=1 Tax=Tasmannia lanceolata TaxID=3420 RepID=UPI0040643949